MVSCRWFPAQPLEQPVFRVGAKWQQRCSVGGVVCPAWDALRPASQRKALRRGHAFPSAGTVM